MRSLRQWEQSAIPSIGGKWIVKHAGFLLLASLHFLVSVGFCELSMYSRAPVVPKLQVVERACVVSVQEALPFAGHPKRGHGYRFHVLYPAQLV